MNQRSDVITFPTDNQVPAILKVRSTGFRVEVDPSCNAISTVSCHLAYVLDHIPYTRDFHARSDNDDSIRTSPQVGAENVGDGLFVGIILIIQHHPRSESTNAVAPFPRVGSAHIVRLFTSLTKRSLGPFKKGGIELPDLVALGTYHLLEAAVKLYGSRPGTLGLERNHSGEGLHGRVKSINILGVEAKKATFFRKRGE
jgi:hypothetical protein